MTLFLYFQVLEFYFFFSNDFEKINKKIRFAFSYTDYVSNWNDMSCSMWAVLNAILALAPNSPTFMYSSVSAFNAIAPTFSIGVAGAFWCLLPAERQSKDLVSLHQHGFLAVITVADMLFSAAPIRFGLVFRVVTLASKDVSQ